MPKKLKDFLLRHWGCVLASLPSEVPSFPLGLGEQYSQNARATTGLSSCSLVACLTCALSPGIQKLKVNIWDMPQNCKPTVL